MSDEAFARRFYSDRAELTGLGVPLHSQRDEFTGEELYTLRSENYFLERLDLDDDELAALQTALYYLEGKFAYAEPLRLALQNLALGPARVPRTRRPRPPSACASTRPTTRPELAGRLSKLEAAISKQRTITFSYWSPRATRRRERTLNPYALRLDEGVWYVVGHDLDRDAIRTFRVSRIRSDIRFATRRERDFRLPPDFDVEAHRVPRPWQIGELVGRARIEVQGDTAWWVHRTLSDAGTLEDGVFETRVLARRAAGGLGPAPERARRPARARGATRRVADGLARCATATTATRRSWRASAASTSAPATAERPVGPVAPERFGVLQALLAHLLSSCGDETRGRLDADELAQRFSIPREELQDHLSLLNLVNFGGGCYTVYAEVDEDGGGARRQGAVRRRVPQAAQADAARGARDPPRDRVRRPHDRRRGAHAAGARAAQARGDVRPFRARADTGAARPASTRRQLVRTLSDGRRQAPGGGDRVPEGGRGAPAPALSSRTRSCGSCPSGACTRGIARSTGRARPARPHALGPPHATRRFDPREDFDPNYLAELAVARVWALAGDRALEDRAWRAAAHRPLSRLRALVQDARVAALRGAGRPRREHRARAGADAPDHRPAGTGAGGRARVQPDAPAARGKASLNDAPSLWAETSFSEPPCASATARAT